MYRYGDIGKRLKECRQRAGMTQGDVARHCQCSTKTVSAWENGKRPLTAINVIELAALYEESADYILTGKRPTPELSPMLAKVFAQPGVMPKGPGFVSPVLGK